MLPYFLNKFRCSDPNILSNLIYLAHWSLWSQGRGKALEVQSYECWDLRGWCWWEEINFFKNFYFILARLHRAYLFPVPTKSKTFSSCFTVWFFEQKNMRKSFSNFTQQVYLCTTEVAYGGQTNAWFVSQSDRPEQQYSDPGYKEGADSRYYHAS